MCRQPLQSHLPQLWKNRQHPPPSRLLLRVGAVVSLNHHPEQFLLRSTQVRQKVRLRPCRISLNDQTRLSSLAANLRSRRRQRLQGRRSFVSSSPSRCERLDRRVRRVVRAGRVDLAAKAAQVDRVDRVARVGQA